MPFRISDSAIFLDIKATPGSSRTEIVGVIGDRLYVKIASAPENGKANAELCAFLAKRLDCAKKDVVLKFGEKSRLKTVALPVSVKGGLEKLIVDSRKGL
ncbi:MAG: DUF167 domain-containing protein [Treponema sp.]|jgi:uncharacterized protein (TIGR00251 family)|nr:DUF167 domain-containing protein [Treponema sp.]